MNKNSTIVSHFWGQSLTDRGVKQTNIFETHLSSCFSLSLSFLLLICNRKSCIKMHRVFLTRTLEEDKKMKKIEHKSNTQSDEKKSE